MYVLDSISANAFILSILTHYTWTPERGAFKIFLCISTLGFCVFYVLKHFFKN